MKIDLHTHSRQYMRLSIITVSWNVRDRLRACLKSVFENKGDLDIEYFVIDNASRDGTPEMVRAEFPWVRLIVNDANTGFAHANNQGIQKSTGDFVLLLNPDMRVLPNTLPDMAAWMRAHPRAGVASCRLVDEHGALNMEAQPRRFPGVWDQAALLLKIPHIFPHAISRYRFTDFDSSREQAVDSVRGSFFMIRREVLDMLKGLDERYFIWFEEVDFCKQVYQSGFEVWYVPSVTCIDYVGQSFAQQPTLWKQKQFTASMAAYFKKWHPCRDARIISALRPVALFITRVFARRKPI